MRLITIIDHGDRRRRREEEAATKMREKLAGIDVLELPQHLAE